MPDRSVHVLILAAPGPWREGLRVLLTAFRRAVTIAEAGEIATGQILIAQDPPDIILVDASLIEAKAAPVLQRIAQSAAGSLCLVLTHSSHQEQQARAAGAAAVLPDGFTTEALYAALDAAIQE